MKTFKLFLLIALTAVSAFSAPQLNAALNAASYSLGGFVNSGLAQGSIFVGFGTELGPANLVQNSGYPLPAQMAGTSIEIISGGTTYNVVMVYTSATQVAGIIPSNVPAGPAQMRVRFNNQTSNNLPVQIVPATVGIFTLNQAGSGPGVFTDNPGARVVTLTHPTHPGDAVTAWVNGLGAIGAPDNQAPPVANLNTNVQVTVGGKPAQVIYKGRSACCAGLDQVNFIMPDVNGCYLPVVITANGIPSNFTTISSAPSGQQQCTDTSGFNATDLQAIARGDVKVGTVDLNRIILSIQGQTLSTDSADGSFFAYPGQTYLSLSNSDLQIVNIGGCMVFQFRGDGDDEFPDPVAANALDAGAGIQFSGPGGTVTATKVEPGLYNAAGGGLPLPVPVPGQQGPFIAPGAYTVTGPGGAQVGPFTTTINVPQLLNWTNKATINNIPRTQGLPITWTGGDANSQYVAISGASTDGTNKVQSLFFCSADPAAGSFTVPADVLQSMAVSGMSDGEPLGVLMVGNACRPSRFTATGLDIGLAGCQLLDFKQVNYQ